MPDASPGPRLPLTAAQRGVWAAHRLDPADPRYTCASCLEFHGPVDADLLRRAVRTALSEAEALRVRLDETDGWPGQTVTPVADDPLELVDLTPDGEADDHGGGGARDAWGVAEAWMRADLARPTDLLTGPLVRHVLVTAAPGRRLLYLRYHHIVMDGLGQTVHLRRVAEVYGALAAGTTPPASRALPLRRLLDQDTAYAASPAHDRDRAHWLTHHTGRPEPVSLGEPVPVTAPGGGSSRDTTDLTDADTALLADTARQLGVRSSALLVAAVAAYQARITGREETVLRMPLAARPSAGALATPAMFANELPLRIAVPRAAPFAELVAALSAALGRALAHQRFRGEELHRALFPDGRRAPLAGTAVNVVTFDADLRFGDVPGTAHHLSSGPADDLRFDFFSDARGSRVRLDVEADPRRHAPGAPAAHGRRLLALLRGALARPGQPVGRLPLMDDAEHRAVLAAGAPRVRPYELTSRLHERVAAQAAATPGAVAVQTAREQLTYRELADRARRLAAELGRRGVGRGDVVGVHQERSPHLVVSLLAVLTAGAAYLPLDPALPLPRLAFQIEDAGAGLVLSTAALAERLAGTGADVLAVDRLLPGLPPPGPDAVPDGRPDDLAYVMYTSGSTGTPKGVAVPHRGVVNRLLWMQEEYGLGADECVMQKTPFTFDVSVWEFFWPLLAGARLHLAAPGAHRDPRALAAEIRAHGVTTTHFVPPMLDLFLDEPSAARLPGLRRVLCSGEALRPGTVARFLAVHGTGPGAPALHNLYGPTEASIDVTHWHCTERDTRGPVPIGRAVANTGLYVLDPGGRPLPFGVPGELHIGGVQVAAGYVNRPGLTAERFVADPFGGRTGGPSGDVPDARFGVLPGGPSGGVPGGPRGDAPGGARGALSGVLPGAGAGRLYRTGDLAVLREDGVVEYRGRIDDQVKVRGLRVEPGEIEAALLALPGVGRAVVTAPRGPAGERHLVAHVVMGGEGAVGAVNGGAGAVGATGASGGGGAETPAEPSAGSSAETSAAGPARAVTGSATVLAAALRERLPAHMVPSVFVFLDALPLLPNGKVDRRALPEPPAPASAPGPVAGPVSEAGTEAGPGPGALVASGEPEEPDPEAVRLVHDAYAEVLGVPAVDLHTSFFALGGDSLLSIRMRTRLERAGLTFDLPELYDAPSVRALARRTRPHTPGAPGPDGARADGPGTADGTGDTPHTRVAPFALLSAADRERLPAGLEDAHPLSAMQTGMVFHAAYEEGGSVYRVVTSVRVALPLDEALLRGALDGTARRHPALRSSFRVTGFGEPLQLVHRDVRVPLTVDEGLRGADDATRDAALAAWAERAKHHDFDLTRPPLLHFTAHPLTEGSFQLGVVEHHVVLDGWSDAVMLDEVVRRYRAALSGEDLDLPPVPSAFRDFVAAERAAADHAGHRAFWAGELAGAEASPLPAVPPPAAPAPAPEPGPEPGAGGAGARHRRFDVPLDKATGTRLAAAARAAGLPLKSLLAAAHAVVLHTVTPGEEVLTGVVTHGRLAEEGGDRAIGVFLNTLPLRLTVTDGSWLELARRVHDHERRTLPHRRYPYARVLRDHEDLALDSYVNFMDFHQRWGTDAAIQDGFGIAETDFPLAANFLVDPAGGRLGLWLDCDVSRLDPGFCARLAGYYAHALAAIAADPGALPPGDLRGPDERALERLCNDTAVPFDADATVPGLIALRAEAVPDAPAVDDGHVRLTYAELDERAARLAHHLRALGARRGRRVGVGVRRGADLVVTLLAVTRTGAAYVPLDPAFPADRLRHIAADAALDCLVLGPPPAPGAQAPDQPGVLEGLLPARAVVRLDADAARIAKRPTGPLHDPPRATDPVYVIYTSGSTGRPKGTVLRHRNVVNFLTAMDRRVGLTPDDTVLALTSVSFDISVLELLWPLTHGATVAVAPERMIERLTPADGPHSLCDLLARHRTTLLQATPSFLAAVAAQPEALEALRPLRALLVGGEAFPSGLAARLLAALPSVRVLNMYGPTETTVWSTAHELDRERDAHAAVLPIGRPLANTWVRVVLPDGREAPLGVPGELWIGGEGVAAGYLGRPDLTDERFLPTLDGRCYRTGDRVRRRADGTLEFLGRIDRQVKILGHRVEPDEVESVLSRHPEVASVAVVAAPRAGGGPTELVAYVAPAGPGDPPAGTPGEETGARDTAGTGAETGFERTHVERWREVWEGAYAPAPTETDTEKADADDVSGDEADFAGWLSTYTKRPVPAHEMREWLGHTVRRIRATGGRRIVDVGVGVGLYLRALAPHTDSYLGIDLSPAALATAAASVAADGRPPAHVTLRQGEATALAGLPDGAADLVLLNSVVQYFPGPGYLRRVLAEALRVAGPAGAVFVGDVRDLTLLPAFHADTQVRRAASLTPAPEVAAAAARALAEERELCLAPAFFEEVAAAHGAGLRVELKRGRAANELTRFRRDVTLYGPAHPHAPGHDSLGLGPGVDGKRLDWSEVGGTGALEDLLAGTAPERALAVTALPDRRLVRPLAAAALLRGGPDDGRTAWDLEKALWEVPDETAPHPEDLAGLGERHAREVRLTPSRSGGAGAFDAVFEPRKR